MIWSWIHGNPRLVDRLVVAFLLLCELGLSGHSQRPAEQFVLGVCETLPLLWRRRWPLETAAIVTTFALAMIVTDVWVIPLQLGVALYTVASLRDDDGGRSAIVASVLAVAIVVIADGGFEFGAGAARVVFLCACALAGNSIGSRRAYVSEIEQKAARLERERDSEMRRAAAEEQARIARELHDVVAHALSVVIIQAGAADDAFQLDPERAREPIRAIDAAARSALGDLRRVLGILHESAAYEPQPGLAQLDRLVDQVRSTGLEVTLETQGKPRPLSAAVDLSAFRIVQEALTNSLKHAAARHVRVLIRYGERLGLEIHDDGRGVKGESTGGSGLVGMRERVGLLGGVLAVGPQPGGGYRVAAEIPIEEGS